MLDYFIEEQKIVYRTLINSINNNKLSHAFLIETNGYPKSLDLAKSFAKCILCPKNYSNNKNCNDCHQCEAIDKNEFIELKIIEPDGQWIKKSQLDELQELFSKKSIIGDKKVYIINNAEKLNASSSNSLLKFLEEPEDGIIAILIAENTNKVLSTIRSRCQILFLNNKKNLDGLSTLEKISNYLKSDENGINEYKKNEENKIKLEKLIEFLKYYEENHLNTLIYTKKLWHDNFKEKDEIEDAFTLMMLFYKDVLNFKLKKDLNVFNEYIEIIDNLQEKNTIDEITRKINVIINLREKIKFNINQNMLIDKLIIEMEGSE